MNDKPIFIPPAVYAELTKHLVPKFKKTFECSALELHDMACREFGHTEGRKLIKELMLLYKKLDEIEYKNERYAAALFHIVQSKDEERGIYLSSWSCYQVAKEALNEK